MHLLNSNIRTVKAFAPATVANVAIGFDVLGFTFAGVGDYIQLTRRHDDQFIIDTIKTVNANEQLPFDIKQNTASYVIQKACAALNVRGGFNISIEKGIPLSSGMGGSAASAVAALTAFNAFLAKPLSPNELLPFALLGEEIASGQAHADNIAPCIFGGLTLTHSLDPVCVLQLPTPNLYCVLIHPHLYISTKAARKILKEHVPLKDHVKQSANLAAFITSLYESDLSLFAKSLEDNIIEPQRAHLIPAFYEMKNAALNAGALGFSISGSGPTLFAFAKTKQGAETVATRVQAILATVNIQSDYWIAAIQKNSAHVCNIQYE